jgi:TPR repeat protein
MTPMPINSETPETMYKKLFLNILLASISTIFQAYAQEPGAFPIGLSGGNSGPDTETLNRMRDQEIHELEVKADAGDAKCQCILGLRIIGERGDIELGKSWLEKAAAQNYPSAQYELGLCYAGGRFGNGHQFDRAVMWMRPAAISGLPEAQGMYGYYLVEGLGIPQNIALGMTYLKKAAEQGNSIAKDFLENYRRNPPQAMP